MANKAAWDIRLSLGIAVSSQEAKTHAGKSSNAETTISLLRKGRSFLPFPLSIHRQSNLLRAPVRGVPLFYRQFKHNPQSNRKTVFTGDDFCVVNKKVN